MITFILTKLGCYIDAAHKDTFELCNLMTMMKIRSTLVLIKLTVLTHHWLSLWLNIDSVPFSLRVACEQAPGGASAKETFGAKRRVRGLLLTGLRRMFCQRLLLQEPVHRLASLRVDDALGSLSFDPYNYNKSNYSCIILPHDIMEDRWIAVVISVYLLLCYCINLIKRFHLVVCTFSKRSQMMSKWGNNKNSVIYYWTIAQHHGIYICLIYQRVCFVPSGSSLWLVFVFKTLS